MNSTHFAGPAERIFRSSTDSYLTFYDAEEAQSMNRRGPISHPGRSAWIILGLGLLYAVFYTRPVAENSMRQLPDDVAASAQEESSSIFLFGTAAGLVLSAILYAIIALSILRAMKRWAEEKGDESGLLRALSIVVRVAFIAPLALRLIPGADGVIAGICAVLMVGVTLAVSLRYVTGVGRSLIPVGAALLISVLFFSGVYRPLLSFFI